MRTKAKVTAVPEVGAMDALCAIVGAVLVAVALYAVLAVPGVLSDRDSTVPARAREARR